MTDSTNPLGSTSVGLDNLPSPPFVAMEIIRLTRDEDSSASDLADVLSNDPVLSSRILQVANSPAYGLSREVTSIDRATALLGLKAVKMMALSFSLASDIGSDTGAMPVDTYWYHSLLNAVTARRWAELMAPGLAEEAFLAGLLSHLGRLVLAQERVVDFANLMAGVGTGWPSFEEENAEFGFSSAEITGAILEEWGLPSLIVEGVRAMNDLSYEPSPEVNGADEVASVLRNVVVTEHALGESAGPDEADALTAALASAGLDSEAVDDFVVDLESRLRDMANMLDVAVPEGMSHQTMLNEARNRLVEVSLQAVQNLHSAEQQAQELRESNEELGDLAFKDRLTGLHNRAAFDDHMARLVAGAVRTGGEPVGVAIFDIDHFKSFNDTYGHQIGDDVLAGVAQAMEHQTRDDEMLARYGGEEFVLVATNCDVEGMLVVGERLRSAVADTVIPTAEHGDLSVTISVGVAVNPVFDMGACDHLVKLADEALYAAKENGRNQVMASTIE